MIKIVLNNKVWLKDCPGGVKYQLEKELKFDNPDFLKAKRMGLYTDNIEEEIKLSNYYSAKQVFSCPVGYWPQVKKVLDQFHPHYKVVRDERVDIDLKIKMVNEEPLRDKQVKAVESAEWKSGIVILGTGMGKTRTMLEIIKRKGKTALILVPKKDILYQWKEEAEKVFKVELGQIGDGKKDIKEITVATYQSLTRNMDLVKELAEKTSVLVCDEVHRCPSDRNREVLSEFKPVFTYGCSATEKRADKLHPIYKVFLGEKIYESLEWNVEVEVKQVKTWAKFAQGLNYSSNYHLLAEQLSDHEERNKMVETLVRNICYGEHNHKVYDKDAKMIVLVKRVEHARNLKKLLKDRKDVKLILSTHKKRREKLEKFRKEGNYKVIIGTISLLSEGVDLPHLNKLVLAGDLREATTLWQSIGRVTRKFKGKTKVKIWDLVDNLNHILSRQAEARMRFYEEQEFKIGFDVEITDEESPERMNKLFNLPYKV